MLQSHSCRRTKLHHVTGADVKTVLKHSSGVFGWDSTFLVESDKGRVFTLPYTIGYWYICFFESNLELHTNLKIFSSLHWHYWCKHGTEIFPSKIGMSILKQNLICILKSPENLYLSDWHKYCPTLPALQCTRILMSSIFKSVFALKIKYMYLESNWSIFTTNLVLNLATTLQKLWTWRQSTKLTRNLQASGTILTENSFSDALS